VLSAAKNTSAQGAWLGGHNINNILVQFAWDGGPEAGIVFSTGLGSSPEFCPVYCNWQGTEPNNDTAGGLELYVVNALPGTWNDYPGGSILDSFIVEVSTPFVLLLVYQMVNDIHSSTAVPVAFLAIRLL